MNSFYRTLDYKGHLNPNVSSYPPKINQERKSPLTHPYNIIMS